MATCCGWRAIPRSKFWPCAMSIACGARKPGAAWKKPIPQGVPRARTAAAAYNDYRELLARSDIDAVVIATPDHWHTLQAIDAAKAGKDIYCEKPVSVTIREGRQLVETVRRYGRVFQTGTQYRSIPKIRAVCEFVRAGGLGKIKSVFTLWQNPGVDGRSVSSPTPKGWMSEDRRLLCACECLSARRTGAGRLGLGPVGGAGAVAALPSTLPHEPVPGVVPWAFAEAFGTASVTWFHSHAADVIQYALGMENSGPVEIIHPSSGRFPTLTCRYANGVLLHHVDDWKQVIDLYKAVPAGARLEGNFGECSWASGLADVDDRQADDLRASRNNSSTKCSSRTAR